MFGELVSRDSIPPGGGSPDSCHLDEEAARKHLASLEASESESRTRPKAGDVEERHHEIATEGRKIRGVVPYGVESRDMGGWKEVISPSALRATNLDELIARVDHAGVPIGRFPKTLAVEEKRDGLHWSLEPPKSRADLLEAVERGDLQAGSWQMVVAKDRWEGDTRHVEQIAELRDVSIVSSPAYPAAAVEYRSRPITSAEDAPQKDATDMSEAEKSEEQRSEEKTEARVVSEPTPVLGVEDRSLSKFRTLTEEFRSKGFPGETASLGWDEFRNVESRAVTWSGTIDALDRLQTTGGPLGYDQRYIWNSVPNVAVDAGVTSVSVFQQTSRSLNAGTAVVRAIDATSNKPEVGSTLNIANVQLKQVAGVETGIPNVYLESDALASVVEEDLRFQVYDGLDSLFVSAVAASGFQTPLANPYLSIRGAITTLRASGYTPDVVALTPTDSAAVDVLVTGLTGGTADFVNGPGNYGPQTIFGLRRIESKSLPASVVWDSGAHGKMYVAPINLARFEESAGRTNTSLVRLETNAQYGTERTAAALRIAAS